MSRKIKSIDKRIKAILWSGVGPIILQRIYVVLARLLLHSWLFSDSILIAIIPRPAICICYCSSTVFYFRARRLEVVCSRFPCLYRSIRCPESKASLYSLNSEGFLAWVSLNIVVSLIVIFLVVRLKITSQHWLIFAKPISKFGIEIVLVLSLIEFFCFRILSSYFSILSDYHIVLSSVSD